MSIEDRRSAAQSKALSEAVASVGTDTIVAAAAALETGTAGNVFESQPAVSPTWVNRSPSWINR